MPLVLASCCALLLLSEAGVFLWRLRRVGAPQPWRRWRVLLPAALGAGALGVAAVEWQAMRALSDTQPDFWSLAFPRQESGAWVDQMSAALYSAQICGELLMLATLVVLVVGALRQLALEADLAD